MQIIGRRQERQTLARLEASTHPEFLAVMGRRRVGKTYLIREFFADRLAFDLTGTLASRSEQMAAFDRAAARHGTYPPSRTWPDAFATLRTLLETDPRPGKKVVFIDELPWLATARSGLLEALGEFWNSWGSTRPDLLLIVCGSSTSWMTDRLLTTRGGLHNRLTATINLQPFTLGECEEFLTARNLVMNRYQMVECYMIFGGVPQYLALLQPQFGRAQNVDALCFAESG
ncbi:MAG: ATP-binding protein, partial [Propionibacteriaceae bacterium]|nr:ATP-binding protein [Propionibacteriaceae bacterium]